jgi:hypothetical protein
MLEQLTRNSLRDYRNPCRGTDELGQGFLATGVAYKRCHDYLQTYITN